VEELKQYVRIAEKWWWLVFLSTFVAAGFGYGVTKILPPTYRATTTLLVKVGDSTGDTYATNLASEQVAVTYVELLATGPVIEAAATPLGLDLRKAEKKVGIEVIPKTSLIEITAKDSNPHIAMELANAMFPALSKISLESGSSRIRDLYVMEPATLPTRPIAPSKLRIIPAAAMTGSVLATGLVFLFEFLNKTIESVDDIHRSLSLPALTIIPRLTARRKRDSMLLVDDKAASIITEAYRVLRTNLQLSHANGGLHTLLVATPQSQDDKALVVANLGLTMAKAGHRVLMVDADLRQPQLHRLLGVAQEPGLSTLLAETGDGLEVIVETGAPNLHLIPGGPTPPDPLALLSSPRMAWLIEKLKERTDIVLFNTPPVLIAADAVVLAAQVDAAVMVVQSRSTKTQSATWALKMLRNVGAGVLGAILTGVRPGSSGYQYYSDFSRPEKPIQAVPHQDSDGLRRMGAVVLPASQRIQERLSSQVGLEFE
jgi:capsular exopolysaccharide synthesis family protein